MRRLVFVFALIGVIGLVVWAATAGVRRWSPSPPVTPTGPMYDGPAVVDVGECEIYSLAVARFTIRNPGDAELVLGGVRTGCACTGLEEVKDGKFYRADEVRVPPGGSTELAVRRGVHGPPGVTIDTPILFRTNDPAAPEQTVRVLIPRVTGGVEASPKSVVCGVVAVGSVVRRTVTLVDEAVELRAIKRVVSSDPERVTVRVVPAAPGEPAGTLARLEVTVTTQTAASVDARVEVYVAGRAFPTVVPVGATVTAAVELSPRAVVVPLRSGGVLTYTAACVCRGTAGQAIDPQVVSCPPDLTVVVREGAGPVRTLAVTWNPKHAGAADTAPRVVKLRVRVGDVDHTVELEVHCQTPEAP